MPDFGGGMEFNVDAAGLGFVLDPAAVATALGLDTITAPTDPNALTQGGGAPLAPAPDAVNPVAAPDPNAFSPDPASASVSVITPDAPPATAEDILSSLTNTHLTTFHGDWAVL